MNPLGAAVLARLVIKGACDYAVFADAWVGAYGLPFAACAAVELLEVDFDSVQHWNGCYDGRVRMRPQDARSRATDPHRAAADRVRALLAEADEESYPSTVTALAGYRDGARRRTTVSYLVPTELAWLAECCTDLDVREHADDNVRSLLLCSLGSAEQLGLFPGKVELGWQGWSTAVVATLAEGVGAAMAPLLVAQLNSRYVAADTMKTVSAALSELPGDEAFGALLDRAGDKEIRPTLLAATRRFPVRALRLLAEAVRGSSGQRSLPRQLLNAHVTAHRDLTLAALPGLAGELAEVVAPLVHRPARTEDVPLQALPPLLTSPPWTHARRAGKPPVVSGLVPPAEPRISWLPGEREAWAAVGSAGWNHWKSLEQLVAEQQRGTLDQWSQIWLFRHGPADLVRPLLDGWTGPEYRLADTDSLRPVLALHEVAALPAVLRMTAGQPAGLGALLLPFLDVEVARLMADWLVRLKTAGATARSWFLRHGVDAARLLIPDAVGKPGPERSCAERALRLIASVHGPEAVREAAAEFGGAASVAVDALLSADPLEAALPARMPVVGDWADPFLLPMITLRTGGALPVDAARQVVAMLAISRPEAVYPGVAQIQELCTPESLAEFCWALFEEWRVAGMPVDGSWALHALGRLGNDETVRRLTPVLRAWPGENAHHRAVDGLEVLAAIGTETALLHLQGIAQRVKFKALKVRAQEKIAEVASELGLSGEQLADRLVPDFGLEADGSTVVDYGPRRFTVGFDAQLKPYVLDEDGKARKDLPTPGAADDAQLAPVERKRFAALRKDVRTLAAVQAQRLEAAMVTGRSWTAAEFRQLLVGHPLLGRLVRRLVWLTETGTESASTATAFRVAEDGTFADLNDDALTLPDAATVRLPHPLHLGAASAAWSERLGEHGIVQPFPQLDCPVHTLTDEEAAGARLTRFEGITVPTGKVLGLQRHGWDRGEPMDAGIERWISRRLGPDRHLVIALDEGIVIGAIDVYPDQTLETVWLDTCPGDHWSGRDYPLRFGDLDPVIASELLADLTELTDPAEVTVATSASDLLG